LFTFACCLEHAKYALSPSAVMNNVQMCFLLVVAAIKA